MIVTFLASFLIWFLFFGLFILWIIDGRFRQEAVLHALLAMLIVWFATSIIKDLYPIQRPFLIADGVNARTITTPRDFSFPSTHTAIAFAMSTTIFLHDKKYGGLFFIGALLVALGRILANVHYPVDTLVGGVLGILVAYVIHKTHLFRLLGRG